MSGIMTRLIIAAILLMLGNCKGERMEVVPSPDATSSRTDVPMPVTEPAATESVATQATIKPTIKPTGEPTTEPISTPTTGPIAGPVAGPATGPATGPGPRTNPPPRPIPAADLLVSRTEPMQFHLGRVPTFTSEPARIRMINDTDTPIVLRDCKSNCGCLAANCPKRQTIEPWDTVEIDIRMNSGDQSGGRIKQMDFVFVDRPPSKVIFSLDAVSYVEALPVGLRPESRPSPVALRAVDDTPFRVTGIDPPVAVSLPDTPAATTTIEIDWTAWKRNGRQRLIAISLDHPKCPTVLLTVRTPPPE